jgi:hypothetical protein
MSWYDKVAMVRQKGGECCVNCLAAIARVTTLPIASKYGEVSSSINLINVFTGIISNEKLPVLSNATAFGLYI